MIYTVTLNPALDYVMKVGALRYDDINRSKEEMLYYGGKGINVSVILTRLGIENKALGFVAGFTGNELERMLKGDGVNCDFNRLKSGNTRINVKIKADTELDINAQGPDISEDEIKELFEKLDEVYNRSTSGKLDIMVISGISGGTGSGILADLTYNIRAYGRSKKWQNFRVGGCLLTPDVLFANSSIDWEKRSVLEANAYATLKEMESLMTLTERDEAFVFESGTHRLSIKENIFDSCMLVSGKEDEQGSLPEYVI